MSKRSISRNYLYNLFYQILVIILPLITTPYLSRVLGAESIGIYSFTLSIATYFVLFGSLGVNMYGQREIAYLQEKKHERTIVFFEILIMRFITMFISLIIFGVSYGISGEYAIYYRILILELINQMLDISWFFQGIEEFKKTVIRNSIVKIVFAISIFIFIKEPDDLLKYIFIITISNLLGTVSLWMYLPRYVDKIKVRELKLFRHLKPTISLFIPQIAIQIYTVLDRTMIGFFCENKSEVGFYEQSQKVVKLLLTLVTSLGTVMTPRMANIFAKGEENKIKEYMKKSFGFMSFVAFPMITGIILIAKEFVPIFFGDGYNEVSILIQAISPIILFIGMSNIIGYQYLLPSKQQKAYTISVTLGACINFILNILLIKNIGALGAAISTVIAELTVTSIQIYYERKILGMKDLLKISKNNIIAAGFMFLIVYTLNRLLNINGLISVIFQVILGISIYGILLFILKDEFIYYIKDKVINSLKNRCIKE